MKKKTCARVLSALLIAFAVLAACEKKAPPATAPAGQQNPSPGSDPAADPKHVTAFGLVTAKTTHALYLDFSATLERKLVVEGQRVGRGDALFRFSRADYDAAVASKEYYLTLARLELKKATLAVDKLTQDLADAKTDEERARKDVADREKILSMGGTPRADVEEARGTLRTRQQAVRVLSSSLQEYQGADVNGLDALQEKIALVESELAQLRQQSERGYIAGDTIVCDLTRAVVSEIGYAEGDIVGREKKLCSLIDLDSIVVEANIPEEFVKDVKIGSAASIVPVADTTKKYDGKVSRIAQLATKVNGETVVPVEITMKAPDGFLLPNYNVDVSIY
jgi:HlyD family secretion protein